MRSQQSKSIEFESRPSRGRAIRPLHEADLAVAFRHLSVLLDGGVPLIDALSEIARIGDYERAAKRWSLIARQVDQGQLLSVAVGAAGVSRHKDVVATLAAAEVDGSLSSACASLDESLRARIEHRRRMHTVMAYPIIAGGCLLAASIFLLWAVVPGLAGVNGMDKGLPWHATPLLLMSGALHSVTLNQILAFCAVATALAVSLYRCPHLGGLAYLNTTQHARATDSRLSLVHSVRVRQPGNAVPLRSFVTNSAADNFQLATYMRILQRLRQHGTPLIDAMEVAEEVVVSSRLRVELLQARNGVVAGNRLAQGLGGTRWIPPLVARLVAIGETSGTLGASFERAADVLEAEAQRRLERLEVVAPLVVLGLVGAFLLWIIISIVMPVYGHALSGVLDS